MRFYRSLLLVAGLGVLMAFMSPSRPEGLPRGQVAFDSPGPLGRRAAGATLITVYHSPTCGCCKKWIAYLKENGFTVTSIEQEDLSEVKAEAGVTGKLVSCHTALVQGYAIEGHVPAGDIQRLLKEKPKVTGLTAPGMPGAGPGMDAGKDPYEVLTFDAKGRTTVWAKH